MSVYSFANYLSNLVESWSERSLRIWKLSRTAAAAAIVLVSCKFCTYSLSDLSIKMDTVVKEKSMCDSNWRRRSATLLLRNIMTLFLGFQLAAFMMMQVEAQGGWEVIVNNAGIASMHTAVTHYNTAVLLDRTDIGPSQLPLPDGVCRNDPNDQVISDSASFHWIWFGCSS